MKNGLKSHVFLTESFERVGLWGALEQNSRGKNVIRFAIKKKQTIYVYNIDWCKIKLKEEKTDIEWEHREIKREQGKNEKNEKKKKINRNK